MCESETMAIVMLEGALSAARRRRGERKDGFTQDEEKVKRTLIGPDIPGTKKILPEHMPYGLLPPGGNDTLISGGL